MSLKSDHGGARESAPLRPPGDELRPGWIAKLRVHPDRFMIGSDQFLGDHTERLRGARRLIDALPPDLKVRVTMRSASIAWTLPPGSDGPGLHCGLWARGFEAWDSALWT